MGEIETLQPAPACYADVAVNAPTPQHLTFSYAVPPGMAVQVGQAVWAPFGSRLAQGIVVELSPAPRVEGTRFLDSAVEGQPPLVPWQVDLARWLSQYYGSSVFEAAALFMPPGFEQRVLTLVRPVPAAFGRSLETLAPRARKVLQDLECHGRTELERLKARVGDRRAADVVNQLVQKGLVLKEQVIQRPKVGPKQVASLCLNPLPRDAALGRSPRQAELLASLEEAGGRLSRAALAAGGFGAAVAAGLVKKGLARWETVRYIRDPLAHLSAQMALPPTLTARQAVAWGELREALDRQPDASVSRVFLLFGVTGSGKTEIYLRALAHVVAQGRKAIVLVPEIALTPQTVDRFAARFPGRVAVLHSGLSPGEQFDEWWRIHDGDFDVVIGSRSAIFAPQPSLGLVVIDEEHEWTYKQSDPAPRYHARRVAEEVARRTGAVLVLGSATPDLESYSQALRGRSRLLELPERASPKPPAESDETPGQHPSSRLPDVEVVDLRRELQEGNRSIFSRALARGLEATLESGRQAILFLNRRGSASFVQCRDCGHVMTCRRCDLALTYHAPGERLLCHQCNARVAVPSVCPRCASPRIKFLGLGTERVEEEVRKLFPAARVVRWDRDTARTRHAHEAVLRQFQTQQGDILVGTQMVAKGLDLPQVTLVGVINADVNLYLPDFRAAERTFQLLTQVAGRAGRGPWAGNVVIQTYSPEHYAIVAAAQQDYRLFYQQEMTFRRGHGYPPFGRMARLLFTHPRAAQAQQEAEALAHRLREEAATAGIANIAVYGPVPAYPRRVRGRYRWQIILLGGDPHPLLERVVLPRDWLLDVDPVGLG